MLHMAMDIIKIMCVVTRVKGRHWLLRWLPPYAGNKTKSPQYANNLLLLVSVYIGVLKAFIMTL